MLCHLHRSEVQYFKQRFTSDSSLGTLYPVFSHGIKVSIPRWLNGVLALPLCDFNTAQGE